MNIFFWSLISLLGLYCFFFIGLKKRLIILEILLIALLLSGVASSQLLSLPKPIGHEWLKQNVNKAIVLAVDIQEGRAIYLWLKLDDSDKPLYYSMPWDLKVALQLQRAMAEAEEMGGRLGMHSPFDYEDGLDPGEALFYPEPQAAGPPKNYE